MDAQVCGPLPLSDHNASHYIEMTGGPEYKLHYIMLATALV